MSAIPPWPDQGNGPIDAFVHALRDRVCTRKRESICRNSTCSATSSTRSGAGAEARAVSYIQIKTEAGQTFYGAGTDTNIELASIRAIVSALNRAIDR